MQKEPLTVLKLIMKNSDKNVAQVAEVSFITAAASEILHFLVLN